jgi:hypothetical protein
LAVPGLPGWAVPACPPGPARPGCPAAPPTPGVPSAPPVQLVTANAIGKAALTIVVASTFTAAIAMMLKDILFVCIIFLIGTLNYLKVFVESPVLFTNINILKWLSGTLQNMKERTS